MLASASSPLVQAVPLIQQQRERRNGITLAVHVSGVCDGSSFAIHHIAGIHIMAFDKVTGEVIPDLDFHCNIRRVQFNTHANSAAWVAADAAAASCTATCSTCSSNAPQDFGRAMCLLSTFVGRVKKRTNDVTWVFDSDAEVAWFRLYRDTWCEMVRATGLDAYELAWDVDLSRVVCVQQLCRFMHRVDLDVDDVGWMPSRSSADPVLPRGLYNAWKVGTAYHNLCEMFPEPDDKKYEEHAQKVRERMNARCAEFSKLFPLSASSATVHPQEATTSQGEIHSSEQPVVVVAAAAAMEDAVIVDAEMQQ